MTSSTGTTNSASTARPKTSRQPSEQTIDAAIDSGTRLLRLPTFRDRYGEFPVCQALVLLRASQGEDDGVMVNEDVAA